MVLFSPHYMTPSSDQLKALYLLKRNVRALLDARHENQVTLAAWVGHSKAWLNKFLKDEYAEIQFRDLDRIASFFGIAAYQLFQPGIHTLTERRKAGDRRSGSDRRIGHQNRLLTVLRSDISKVPHLAAKGTHDLSTLPSEALAESKRSLQAALDHIRAEESRRQIASTRQQVSGEPHRRRDPRRHDPGAPGV